MKHVWPSRILLLRRTVRSSLRIRGFMGWDSRQQTGHISARLMLFAILLNAWPEQGGMWTW
ncbi:hypothetical protein FSF27_021585 [Escherichia coli]|nr:hypothetical protein [Escherichia coli]